MPTTISREQVIARLCELAADQVGADPAGVNVETDFFSDLNFDSLDVVDYVMKIEEEFAVDVSDEQGQSLRTIRDALGVLWPLLSQSQ